MSKLIILFTVALFPAVAFAFDLSELKQTCSELGFTSGTKDHGNCVITLVKKSKETSAAAPAPQTQSQETLASQLERQRLLQMQQQQIAVQQQLLEEAKRQRQLEALGIAQQGLDFAFPKPKRGGDILCNHSGTTTICQDW